MKLPRRQFLCLAASAAALPAGSRIAQAQTYPTRPITMIVPFPAGGPTDTIARIVAERMRGALGQPIIIDNAAGASGSIGTGRHARASADGYTFGIGNTPTHVYNGATYRLSYDLRADFEPISLIVFEPLLIVSNKAIPAENLKELIAFLRSNPGKVTQSTVGTGGVSQVAGVFFQNETGTRTQFVFYRGSALAMQDMIAGQIDMMIDTSANSVPQVRAGNIKAYAVTAAKRLAAVDAVPTVDEAGLPGFHILNWHGLWAPKSTPSDIVAKLNAAIVAALADPTVRRRLADLGQEIFSPEQQTPLALRDLQNAEIEKWWPVIKAAKIKGE